MIAENKHPRTQVCFWSGQSIRVDVSQSASQHDFHLETDYLPTPQNPLVYHLYGLEKYPESLVLSEDDYLDFLGRIWHDFNQYEKVISDYLRQVLTQSSLLLLGYRLQDWEFRVLFRGIINTTPLNTRQHYSIAIQVDPHKLRGVEAKEAQTYLQKYFEPAHFVVKWGTSQNFVQQLWKEWQTWR